MDYPHINSDFCHLFSMIKSRRVRCSEVQQYATRKYSGNCTLLLYTTIHLQEQLINAERSHDTNVMADVGSKLHIYMKLIKLLARYGDISAEDESGLCAVDHFMRLCGWVSIDGSGTFDILQSLLTSKMLYGKPGDSTSRFQEIVRSEWWDVVRQALQCEKFCVQDLSPGTPPALHQFLRASVNRSRRQSTTNIPIDVFSLMLHPSAVNSRLPPHYDELEPYPIHQVAYFNRRDLYEELLSANADICVYDRDGSLPLDDYLLLTKDVNLDPEFLKRLIPIEVGVPMNSILIRTFLWSKKNRIMPLGVNCAKDIISILVKHHSFSQCHSVEVFQGSVHQLKFKITMDPSPLKPDAQDYCEMPIDLDCLGVFVDVLDMCGVHPRVAPTALDHPVDHPALHKWEKYCQDCRAPTLESLCVKRVRSLMWPMTDEKLEELALPDIVHSEISLDTVVETIHQFIT